MGDFLLREKLGEGAFGAVYRAEQTVLQREAVIKILHQKHQARSEATQRFLREARLASKLDHPFAAHVYAFGAEPDGLLWIAMELVRGTPLSEVLKAQGPMPLERFVPLFDRICDVVHTAHEAGIVHRDLKPANVMVIARAGKLLPKLLDFGIAKATAETGVALEGISGEDEGDSVELTQEGQVIGSPLYMAPEQWVDPAKLVDARTDQYALGVLAFECLHGYGKVPFRASDRAALARAHMKKPIPQVGEGLPATLNAVFARALAKKQVDRYPSVIELAAGFRSASGIGIEKENLPRLDDTLRNELGDAPQPIADAVVSFDAARNAYQARDAMWEIVHVVVRYLGALALACRTRVGSGGEADTATVVDGLRALRQKDVDDLGWLQLLRGMTRPFVDKPDAYPIPELIGFVHGGAAPLERLLAMRLGESGAMTVDEQVRDGLNRALPEVAALLRQVGFLADYVLAVPRDGGSAERWVGPRRVKRMSMAVVGDAGIAGRPVLLDRDGRPVLSLWPLLQIEPPTPGAAPELFLFEGKGRRGARLVAAPIGFERQDEPVWDWFRDQLLVGGEGEETAAVTEQAPYLGLASFRPTDAQYFFGRERQAEAFVNRLKVQPLLAVVGPSGAGKSSFIQAGVVPLLGDDWTVLTVRPGPTPMAALKARVGDLTMLKSHGTPNVLLVVDQFEELFTLCLDVEERHAYAQALVAAAVSAEEPVRIVLTLRDDFLVRAEHERALRDRLAQGLQLLSTPSSDDLLRIVTEPARRVGYGFDDPELPAQMVAAVAEQPGALALLSFTAAKLWDLRDRHFKQLTRKAYDALGGVGGALAQHAEQTLTAMPVEEQRLVREAFRHLVTADGTRAVLGRDELTQLLRGGDVVLEKLIQARLLTASEEGRIEVIHEALLGAWPRLADWRREDAEGARLRDQLRAAARQWVERDRPRGLLWRDDALDEYRRWRARTPGALTDSEEAFTAASLRDAARGVRIRRILYAVGVATLVGIVIYQQLSSREISRQRGIAEGNAVKAEKSEAVARTRLTESRIEQARQQFLAGDAYRAIVYLDAVYRDVPDSAAVRYLVARSEAIVERQRVVVSMDDAAMATAGTSDLLVAGAWDGSVRAWAWPAGTPLWAAKHDKSVWGISLSPDGTRVASASFDGTARLWDAKNGQRIATLPHDGLVYAANFSHDSKRVVTASHDKEARIWSSDGALLLRLRGHTAELDFAEFTADDTQVMTAARDGTVRLWDAVTGRLEGTLVVSPGERIWTAKLRGGRVLGAGGMRIGVWDLAGRPVMMAEQGLAVTDADLSPDGKRLAAASEDGSVRLWNTEGGSLLFILTGHVGSVKTVAFSPDGTRLASGGRDGTARIWSVDSGRLAAVQSGHRDEIWTLRWRDSQALITASKDHTIRQWEVAPRERIRRIAHPGGVFFVTYSPDGRVVATTGQDEKLVLWDRATLQPLRMAQGKFSTVAYSADGRRLVVTRGDGRVELRDAETLAVEHDFAVHEGPVMSGTFSPAGDVILSAGMDKQVKVLDAETGAVRLTLPHGGELYTAAFGQDGRILTAAADGYARVFTGSGLPLLAVRHPLGLVAAVFSSDGQRILTASADNTARMWGAYAGQLQHSFFGHTSQLTYAAFTPDDQLIVTTSQDGTTRVWDATRGTELETIRAREGFPWVLAISPDGLELATGGVPDGPLVLVNIDRDTRGPERLDAIRRCLVALRLSDTGQAIPAEPDCHGSR